VVSLELFDEQEGKRHEVVLILDRSFIWRMHQAIVIATLTIHSLSRIVWKAKLCNERFSLPYGNDGAPRIQSSGTLIPGMPVHPESPQAQQHDVVYHHREGLRSPSPTLDLVIQ